MLVSRRSPKVTATSVEVQVSPATDHLNAIAVSAARPPAMTSAFSTVGRVFSRNVLGRLKGRPEAPTLTGRTESARTPNASQDRRGTPVDEYVVTGHQRSPLMGTR